MYAVTMEPIENTQVPMLPPEEFYAANKEFLDSIEALIQMQRDSQGDNSNNELSPEDVAKLMEENKMLENKVMRLESEVGETFQKLLALRRIRDEKQKEIARNKVAYQQLEMLLKHQGGHPDPTLPNTTIPVSDFCVPTRPSSVTQETSNGESVSRTTGETDSVQTPTNQCDRTVSK